MPEAEIFSLATEGVGPEGAELGIKELLAHSVKQMSAQELKFLATFLMNRRLLLVGISMGSVENHQVAVSNIENHVGLRIEGLIHDAPALVDPKRIVKDLGLKFTPSMAADGFIELFFRTDPCHIIGSFIMLGQSRPRGRDLLAMARQGISLLPGTPEEEIREISSSYATGVVVGRKDPAGQPIMWGDIQHDIHDLSLSTIRGGHGIALKPIDGANKVSRKAHEMSVYTPLDLAS